MIIDEFRDKYFMIYADCFLTKGVNHSSILDITNGKLHSFSSDYNDIIDQLRKHKLKYIIDNHVMDCDIILFNHFIEELIRLDIGCFVDDISCFPKIKEEWDSPSEIINSIIDIRFIFHDFEKIVTQLNSLGCKFLQVRSYKCLSKKEFCEICCNIKGTSILYVEIISKYDEGVFYLITELVEKYTFLHFFIYSVPKELLSKKNNHLSRKVTTVSYSIDSSNDCGKVNKKNFINVSIDSYMENLLYNGCLNRKISIDEFGRIKNCPSMEKYYGNISSDSLCEISKLPDFRKVWFLNKSHIEICNVCEYRCLCTDCRAFVLDKKTFIPSH